SCVALMHVEDAPSRSGPRVVAIDTFIDQFHHHSVFGGSKPLCGRIEHALNTIDAKPFETAVAMACSDETPHVYEQAMHRYEAVCQISSRQCEVLDSDRSPQFCAFAF